MAAGPTNDRARAEQQREEHDLDEVALRERLDHVLGHDADQHVHERVLPGGADQLRDLRRGLAGHGGVHPGPGAQHVGHQHAEAQRHGGYRLEVEQGRPTDSAHALEVPRRRRRP